MAGMRSTSCPGCGCPRSTPDAFHPNGTYADGSVRLRSYCKICEAARSATPEALERSRIAKEKRRRAAGITKRGEKEYCVNGHLRAENQRPGRGDCAACHRERELNRRRASGAKPRANDGPLPCGHSRTQLRYAKGKPKGCGICHRERERARPYNPETHRRWAQLNKDHIREYRRRWNATSGRVQADVRRGGGDSFEYVGIIGSDPCAYCGGPASEVDHIRPVAHGGSGVWTNLAPACRSCNASKNGTELLQFLLRRRAQASPSKLPEAKERQWRREVAS